MARRDRGSSGEIPAITLDGGLRAELRRDGSVVELIVDDTPQSSVDTADNRHLDFEYVRKIGHAIDLVRPEGAPITAVHLGAGALTLPRYVDATRPGSRQQVIEIERDLVDFVREHLPLDQKSHVRVRYGDAREVLGRMPAGLLGTVDIVVVDIFAGARTPAHVTSVEFYEIVARLLAPDGIVCINVSDGKELKFARPQVATVRSLLPHAALLTDPAMLKGRRFGNLVLCASAEPLPFDRMPRLVASGPLPGTVVTGPDLIRFASGYSPVTDADAVPSPLPKKSIFISRG